jgi:diadenosine tetraphosphate (Ap4A) HIT family hydrolase
MTAAQAAITARDTGAVGVGAEIERVPRDVAVARATAERRGPCLVCDIAAQTPRDLVLHRGPRTLTIVARYAVRPGHLLVIARAHAASIAELDEAAWMEASRIARRAAVAVERALSPGRVFVASLGSPDELPMTSAHVHLHVVPVEPGARPAEVLTWARGVHVGDASAWAGVASRIRAAW